MASYHNAPSGDELFPSNEELRLRQVVQRAVPNASPDVVAKHTSAAQRDGLSLELPYTVDAVARVVQREAAQQRAAADAAYEQTVRRYSLPPQPKGKK